MELQHGVIVHAECYVAYVNRKMERCIQCEEPIAKIPEKGFSGGFCCVGSKTDLKQGNVHAECIDAYRAKHSKGEHLCE